MTLLIGLTSVSNVGAEDAIYIEKGKPAPYSGILFTEERANKIRGELLEKDKLELRLMSAQHEKSMHQSIYGLKEREIELFRTQNERLQKLDNTNSTMNYVWFGLGILATGVAVYGARGLAK
jgi:hypothetical protein